MVAVRTRSLVVRTPSITSTSSVLPCLAVILAIGSLMMLQFERRGSNVLYGALAALNDETATKAETRQHEQSSPPSPELPNIFSLMVELQFSDEAARDAFLTDIAPLAQAVRDTEPGTLAYQVMQSDKDPLHVLMMERYTEKEHAYLRVHKQSDAFVAFRPKLQALQDAGKVTLSGHSYTDTAVGFAHREEAAPASRRDEQ